MDNTVGDILKGLDQGVILFDRSQKLVHAHWPEHLGPVCDPLILEEGTDYGRVLQEFALPDTISTSPALFKTSHNHFISVTSRRLKDGAIMLLLSPYSNQISPLLEDALAKSQLGVCIADENLTVLWTNEALFHLLDVPQNIIAQGDHLEKLMRFQADRGDYGAGDRDILVAERLDAAARFQNHRFVRVLPNGKILQVQRTALSPAGLMLSYEDITKREKSQRMLQSREEQFRSYLEFSPIGAFLTNMEGEPLYYNRRLREIFGYTEKEMHDVRARDFYIVEEDRSRFLNLLQNASSHLTYRTQAIRKNGDIFPMLLTSSYLHLRGKQYIFSWVNDLSKIVEAEKTIERLHIQNQLMLESAGVGIFGIDQNDSIQFINPEASRLLGFRPEEIKGNSLFVLFDDKQQMPLELISKFHSQQAHTGETMMRQKSGESISVKYNVTPLSNSDPEAGKVIVFQDISDRVKLEENLRETVSSVEKSSQAKSYFLSAMSHELRTPLNSILGFTQILAENANHQLDDQQKKFLDHIYRSGENLLSLLNEAIDIATIESGQIVLSFEAVELENFLDICQTKSMELAKKHGVHLDHLSNKNQTLYCKADPLRLQQVILHLLSNAIKYNKEGGSVTLKAYKLSDEKVRIAVRDTGVGIAPDEKKDLFSPFKRLGRAHENDQGAGLGLTLSRQLVECMNAKIGFDTTLGQGSTFWVDLPLADPSNPLDV